MCQLELRFSKYTEEELINKLANRPKMKPDWIIKMSHKNWFSEYVTDNAAMKKRKAANERRSIRIS